MTVLSRLSSDLVLLGFNIGNSSDLQLIFDDQVKFLHLINQLSAQVDDLSNIDVVDWKTKASSELTDDLEYIKEFQTRHGFLNSYHPSLSMSDKIALVSELVSDIQASKILDQRDNQQNTMNDEVSIESLLYDLAAEINLNYDESNISAVKILEDAQTEVQKLLQENPQATGKRLLDNVELSSEQLSTLEKINNYMFDEYATRYSMLLKRLDVTLETFKQSHRAKNHQVEMNQTIEDYKQEMPSRKFSVYEALCATNQDVLSLQSKAQYDTSNIAKNFLIGDVPDRGGRTSERSGSMPQFQKRVSESKRGNFRSRGGNRGGNRGKKNKKY